MTVTEFLMLFFGIFTVASVLLELQSLINPKSLQTTSASLTHDKITKQLTELEHPVFEGVCFGFTVNWALAVAEGREEFFYQQIRLLRTYQDNLPSIIERVKIKKSFGFTLTDEERCIDTLPDLAQRICHAQSPLKYKKIYGNSVWQADLNPILKTIAPLASNVVQIFYKTHTFSSQQEAKDYFNELIRLGIGKKTPVIISTADHAMGFKRSGKNWRFININDLFEQDTHKPYFTFDTDALVAMLYKKGTDCFSPQRLTVSTDFIAKKTSTFNHQLKPLEHSYPFIPNNKITSYRDRRIFVSLAAQQGDLTTIKECIQAGWSIFSKRHPNSNSPIFTAIHLGRREVVQAMLSVIQHRINHKVKKDQSTLLHEACRYGHKGIIEDILNINGVIIDVQDKYKRTPLMVLCQSADTNDEPSVLELLLRRNASLMIKDVDGLTALDHARNHLNDQAVELLESHLQNLEAPNQKPESVIDKFLSFFAQPFRAEQADTQNVQLEYH